MQTGDAKIKVALITGGSSGIGLAIAYELARKQFSLLLISNQEEKLKECAIEIENIYKVNCFTLFIDLINPSSPKQIFDYCISHNIVVEILVNNAGILVFSEIADASTEQINSIIQLHVFVPALLCKLFGNEMRKTKHGFILNVSSISSVMPYPGISIYGPTKTFIRKFTRAFRSEMKSHGIFVTCLIPGATATGLYDHSRINIKKAMRLGIMHTPEFVATKAIKALLNNKAECIPGFLNKVAMMVIPIIPSWLIMFLHRKTNWVKSGNEYLG